MPAPNIVTVIQARTGSTRFPQKILKNVLDEPILIRMVERVKNSKYAGTIVVATSTKKDDDIIEDLCNQYKIECFRGSENDLLGRHYTCGLKYSADAVVKIPSDCPLIDPAIIDRVLKFFLDNFGQYDFVSNLHPATYPDGNDVEVISMPALEKAWKQATRQLEREHTTPYIWENPSEFRIKNIEWENGENYSHIHRWTLDYKEDFEFIKTVYDNLYPSNPKFGINDILNLVNSNSSIYTINSKYAGKYWYENHLEELENIEEYKSKLKNKINNQR